jgi:shikimate kinase
MELGPSRASRAAASAPVNPSVELSSQANTSATGAEDTCAAVSRGSIAGDADKAAVLTLPLIEVR